MGRPAILFSRERVAGRLRPEPVVRAGDRETLLHVSEPARTIEAVDASRFENMETKPCSCYHIIMRDIVSVQWYGSEQENQ